jgi:hypothetical protein
MGERRILRVHRNRQFRRSAWHMLPARAAGVRSYEGYRFCPPDGDPQSRSVAKVRQGARTGQGSAWDSGDISAVSGQAARDCLLRCRNVRGASLTQANIIEAETCATTVRPTADGHWLQRWRGSNGTRCAPRSLTQAQKHTPGRAKATDSTGGLMMAKARRSRPIGCGGSPGSQHARALAGHLLDRDRAPSDEDRAPEDQSARVASHRQDHGFFAKWLYRMHTLRIGHKARTPVLPAIRARRVARKRVRVARPISAPNVTHCGRNPDGAGFPAEPAFKVRLRPPTGPKSHRRHRA